VKTILTFTVILILGGLFYRVAADLPFGSPPNADMDVYYIEHAQTEAGANNVVTGILFDYRGFDTLGEATVLFIAVLGVGVIFRTLREDEEYGHD
jgi:multisubunit Na+/H+ antiporter MnhB subunit